MSIHIKDKLHFEQLLLDAEDKLVVVDFFATWCGPCKLIAPKLEEMAATNANIVVLKVDVDECEELAQEFNIAAMPTFLFMKNKLVIEQFSGASVEKLTAAVTRLA